MTCFGNRSSSRIIGITLPLANTFSEQGLDGVDKFFKPSKVILDRVIGQGMIDIQVIMNENIPHACLLLHLFRKIAFDNTRLCQDFENLSV